MTVKKTDADFEAPKPEGPALINADKEDATVKALLKNYPKARQIEKLASGTFKVSFRRKGPVYKRVKR